MTRLLIRSGKGPLTPVSAEATLAQDIFHGNVGNHLYTHAVHKTLLTPGTKIVSNGTLSEVRRATADDCARANEKFDAFVIPLANAFRPQFRDRLENLTAFVKGLTIPVVVVGVGVQIDGFDQDLAVLEGLAPDVQAFVSAVLDRSASIGVRGELTRDYLRGLGFADSSIDIIGCPSLFLHGPDFCVEPPQDRLQSESPIAVSLTAKVDKMGEILNRQAAKYPALCYVAQDRGTIELLLWGDTGHGDDSPLPVHTGHPLYQQDRIRAFVDPWTWLEFMRTCAFAFGTRFHGNVAGLLAGTPAMLLAHDSRTVELADYHAMPYRRIKDVGVDVDAQDLLDAFDPSTFNKAYPDRFQAYVDFLDRNGLEHIHLAGHENPEFAKTLAETRFAPPVRALPSPGTREVASRLRWLRDGFVFDPARHPQALRQRFPYPVPPRPASVEAESRRAAKVADLERVVAKQRRQLQAQRRKLRRQQERMKSQERSMESFQRRLSEQESRSVKNRATRLLGRN